MIAIHDCVAHVNDDLFRYEFYYWCTGAGLRAMYFLMTSTKIFRFNIETVLLNRKKIVGLGYAREGGRNNKTNRVNVSNVFGLVHL